MSLRSVGTAHCTLDTMLYISRTLKASRVPHLSFATIWTLTIVLVQTFSGCGFCKVRSLPIVVRDPTDRCVPQQWAKANPPQKMTGYLNPGWPGCCRAPAAGEHRLVQIADWPAVSIVHHVPIPPDVKSILDSLTTSRSATFAHNSTNTRGATPPSQPPSMSRRTSAVVASALRGDVTPVKTTSLAIPAKMRSGGSPQQVASLLTNAPSRSSTGEGSPSPLPTSNSTDQILLPRRSIDTQGEKRRDHSREAKQSPGRKSAELAGTLSRKGSSHRPSISVATAPVSVNKVTAEAQAQPRKAPTANANSSQPPNPPTAARNPERDTERPNAPRQRSSLQLDIGGLSISSGASTSSSDSGDGSETTVISDGGFTDYLSDESEAELQRQAELKAAVIAQTIVEEQEFRAARQQLANIDLRPPKSWTSNVNSTPRSQSGSSSGSIGASFTPQQFASASYAGHAASRS